MRPFRILLALDKFKGTLSSLAVAQALAAGIQASQPTWELRLLPVSDGGEGLLEAIWATRPLNLHTQPITSPWNSQIQANMGFEPEKRRVWIESANALGREVIPAEKRNPLQLHSFGLGELLLAARALNPAEIVIGLGSSGTADAGMGLASALGWQLRDANDRPLRLYPSQLTYLARLTPPQNPQLWPKLTVLCDVSNPLLGEQGGIRIYSPQKGLAEADIPRLEAAIQFWVSHLAQALGVSAKDLSQIAGAGAAGGLGMALSGLLKAELVSGASYFMQEIGFAEHVAWADWVITGEGAFDDQSNYGKWPAQVIQKAEALAKPVLLVTGQALHHPLPAGVVCSRDLSSYDSQAAQSALISRKALYVLGKEWASSFLFK